MTQRSRARSLDLSAFSQAAVKLQRKMKRDSLG
jgi:hypothetical protein